MKQGFTLVEVLIATAIASLLMVTMFFSYDQLNRSVRKTADIVDIFDAAILVDYMLSKDISGAFIPVQALPEKKDQKKGASAKDESAASEDKKEDKQASPDSAGGNKDQSKVQILKDPFVSKNSGDQLQMLSFITANSMQAYWSGDVGEPKPHCVRIVYTLKEKKEKMQKRPLYTLYRQEGSKLELDPYIKAEQPSDRYVLADNVVSCKLTFVVIREKQEDAKEGGEAKNAVTTQTKGQKKPEFEVKEFKDWQIGKDEKDIRADVKLPAEVFMEITLANAIDSRERTFNIRSPVATTFQEVPVQEASQPTPAPAAKAASKPEGSAAPATTQKSSKESFAENANKLVQNLRLQFGRA
jgi:prepilin-type N-terminal cleavage/methylation domain-containing protein